MVNIKNLFNSWLAVILITLSIKLILFILATIQTSPGSNIIENWIRWDGPHYIELAKSWYQTEGDPANFIVFYPLYPFLIKLLNLFINNFNLSALILAWFFSITSSIALFELVLLDFNKKVALLSVWFLNIFPTSYFLQASYTESLFLTTSLLSIYFFRKNKLSLTSIFSGLSSVSRINGLFLVPLYFAEIFFHPDKTSSIHKLLTASLFSFFGFFIYLLINFFTFGDFFYFSKILAEHWYKKISWPWEGFQNSINQALAMKDNSFFLFLGEPITILLTLILLIFVFLKIRKSYAVYMLINLFLFTSTSFIISTPRYILILFPIYILLARIKNPLSLTATSIIFISLMIKLTLIYTQGNWAY